MASTATPTRAERRARNRAAHAARRTMTDADYREAKRDRQALTWLQVWAQYEAMDVDTVLALAERAAATPVAEPAATVARLAVVRDAPAVDARPLPVVPYTDRDGVGYVQRAAVARAEASGVLTREAPQHIRDAQAAYWLDVQAYEGMLEAECRGHLGGPEEAEFRAAHPAPRWIDYVKASGKGGEAERERVA